jgi:hypothetical protein
LSAERDRAIARFLATLEIARRELAVLDYSHGKLFAARIDANWVRLLKDDMAAAETLEAFVSRFGRFQDTVGDKLIPRALIAMLESPRTMIDNLTRAERLGWIEDTEAWIAARELRNRLVHEYMTDTEQFAVDIRAAGEFIGIFRSSYTSLAQLARDQFGVTENQLPEYLLE